MPSVWTWTEGCACLLRRPDPPVPVRVNGVDGRCSSARGGVGMTPRSSRLNSLTARDRWVWCLFEPPLPRACPPRSAARVAAHRGTATTCRWLAPLTLQIAHLHLPLVAVPPQVAPPRAAPAACSAWPECGPCGTQHPQGGVGKDSESQAGTRAEEAEAFGAPRHGQVRRPTPHLPQGQPRVLRRGAGHGRMADSNHGGVVVAHGGLKGRGEKAGGSAVGAIMPSAAWAKQCSAGLVPRQGHQKGPARRGDTWATSSAERAFIWAPAHSAQSSDCTATAARAQRAPRPQSRDNSAATALGSVVADLGPQPRGRLLTHVRAGSLVGQPSELGGSSFGRASTGPAPPACRREVRAPSAQSRAPSLT